MNINNQIVIIPKSINYSCYVKLKNKMIKVPKSQKDSIQDGIDLLLVTAEMLDYYVFIRQMNIKRSLDIQFNKGEQKPFILEITFKQNMMYSNNSLKSLSVYRSNSGPFGLSVGYTKILSSENNGKQDFIGFFEKFRQLL